MGGRAKHGKEHAQAVAKAIGRCMALRRVRGVRPAQMRQMYMAAVVPTTGYAASTWYVPSRIGDKIHVVALRRVQRLAARLILRMYKSVTMLVQQSEAKLQPMSERPRDRVSNHLTKICGLALDHPLQRCTSCLQRQGLGFPSAWRAVYERYETHMEPEKGLRMSA